MFHAYVSKELICPNCGHKGAIKRLKYIGGIGLTWVITCEKETECWQRYDKQNGLGGEK